MSRSFASADADALSNQTSPLRERSPNLTHVKRSQPLQKPKALVLKPFEPDLDMDEPIPSRVTVRERPMVKEGPSLKEVREAHKARLARMESMGQAISSEVDKLAEAARQQNKERAVADAVSIEEVSQLRLELEIEKARADGLEQELRRLRAAWEEPYHR